MILSFTFNVVHQIHWFVYIVLLVDFPFVFSGINPTWSWYTIFQHAGLNSVCWHFSVHLYICVHQGYCLVAFIFVMSMFVFGIMLSLLKYIWKCFLFYFLEEFKKDWFNSSFNIQQVDSPVKPSGLRSQFVGKFFGSIFIVYLFSLKYNWRSALLEFHVHNLKGTYIYGKIVVTVDQITSILSYSTIKINEKKRKLCYL